jgi:23S rRNA pseudouridine2605 synthase
MSQANLGSRRACEEMIERGRVRVNGKVAHLGDQGDPETDVIEVDGTRLNLKQQQKIYIALNKPKNIVSSNVTHKDDERRTVRQLVPVEGHLYTIGRLDADSEGLVVLTNDGELTNKLTHPRFQHTKTYKVVVQGLPTAETIEQWQNGIELEDGMTSPAHVRITKGSTELTTLRIVMTEGKKRQIRRIASVLGHPVRRLVRTHIGQLELGTLERGDWRHLTATDVKNLSTPAPELKLIRARVRDLRARGQFGTNVPRRSASDDARATTDEKTESERPRLRKRPNDEASEQPRARRKPAFRSGGRPQAEEQPRKRRTTGSGPAGKSRRSPRKGGGGSRRGES